MLHSRHLLLVCILSGLLTQVAEARPRDKEQREPRRQEQNLRDDRAESSAARAAQKALTANGGGRVLSVDRANDGGFRVKVLKHGDVRVHSISPD